MCRRLRHVRDACLRLSPFSSFTKVSTRAPLALQRMHLVGITCLGITSCSMAQPSHPATQNVAAANGPHTPGHLWMLVARQKSVFSMRELAPLYQNVPHEAARRGAIALQSAVSRSNVLKGIFKSKEVCLRVQAGLLPLKASGSKPILKS